MKQKLLLLLLMLFCNICTFAQQIGSYFNVKDANGNKLQYRIISENSVEFVKAKYSFDSTVEIPDYVSYSSFASS